MQSELLRPALPQRSGLWHTASRHTLRAQASRRTSLYTGAVVTAMARKGRRSMDGSTSEQVKATIEAAIRDCPRLPSLIVFDLDYTLWPTWCECHSASEDMPLFAGSREVLDACRAANVRMAIASRTPTPPVATAWMRRLGIASGYFESVQLIPYTQKDTTHFPKIHRDTGVPYSEMLFFDDESGNITRCNRIGVTSIHVSTSTGVSADTFVAALAKYSAKARA